MSSPALLATASVWVARAAPGARCACRPSAAPWSGAATACTSSLRHSVAGLMGPERGHGAQGPGNTAQTV
eukprot:601809-Alexandrium_andersonii.AAC.1